MTQKRLPEPFLLATSGLIRGYQLLVRPLLAGTGACRFVPCCSEYAQGCVHKHGALRGSWLALKRVLRCHPFGGHGLDLVP
jgi:putative membrane protein insertion efficiency factor